MSNPASRVPPGPTLSTSKISATVVLCVTWTPFHDCAPRRSGWTIVRASVQGPGLRRRATAAPADPHRRHEAQRQKGDEHLREALPEPDLRDAEPLAVGKAAVGHGQVLAPQAPGEALERLRPPLRPGHVLRLRITDPSVLVDQVGRHRRQAGLADGSVHVFTPLGSRQLIRPGRTSSPRPMVPDQRGTAYRRDAPGPRGTAPGRAPLPASIPSPGTRRPPG